jgi:hypothetical protein
MTSQFTHDLQRTPEDVVTQLYQIGRDKFHTICVSGDTDCFLDELQGIRLIELLCEEFTTHSIMFTTRLVPSTRVFLILEKLADLTRSRSQLLIPCISAVTFSYPNRIEHPERVPSTVARLAFLAQLSAFGVPCILATRPTFPFAVVPAQEVARLVEEAADHTTIALGEALLLDHGGQIEHRLGLSEDPALDHIAPMTFLRQTSTWRKRIYGKEIQFTRNLWLQRGVPYYLRSPSAIKVLRRSWNFSSGKLDGLVDFDELDGDYLLP